VDGAQTEVVASVSGSTSHGFGCVEGWGDFAFPTPASVVAGQQYTIALTAPGEGQFLIAESAVDYPRGAAAGMDQGYADVTDFAFMTFVLPAPVVTYAWDPTQVIAGTSTPATLTTATVFPAVMLGVALAPGAAAPNILSPLIYEVKLGALPAWFTPSGITCS
jgi:hypothetical protein